MVIRCYKCQKFGHVSSHCRQEFDTCPVCSGRHTYEACTVRDSAEPKKCANCDGSHSASYRGCSKFLLAVALWVTHRATGKHLSYRDALIQIKKENREATQSAGPATLETGSVTLNNEGLARNSTHTVLPRAPEALAAVVFVMQRRLPNIDSRKYRSRHRTKFWCGRARK